MVLAQGRAEIGGGQMLGMGLMRAPFHEQAVAKAAEQTRHKHGRCAANPTAVVIMRGVQPLMETIFDAAKTGAVKLQPLLGVESVGFRAGQQRHLFILSALGLAQQSGGLSDQWKANLLRGDWLGPDGAADQPTLFIVQGAELCRRRLPRGENPPWGREPVPG